MECILSRTRILGGWLSTGCPKWRMLRCRFVHQTGKSGPLEQEKARKRKRILFEIDEFRLLNDGYPKWVCEADMAALMTQQTTESDRDWLFKSISREEKFLELKIREKKQKIDIIDNDLKKNSLVFLDGSEQLSGFNSGENLWKERVQKRLLMEAFHAATHGVPIVFDLDFHSNFITHEKARVAVGICNMINLHHKLPQHIIVTGCKNEISREMFETSRTMLFVDVFDKCFLDVFDIRQLVYLCPDAPPLNSFEDDKVYVLQGMRAANPDAQSGYLKAKQFGIQCGSFPISRYHHLNSDLIETYTPGRARSFSLLLDLFYYKNFEETFTKHSFVKFTEISSTNEFQKSFAEDMFNPVPMSKSVKRICMNFKQSLCDLPGVVIAMFCYDEKKRKLPVS